MWISPSAWCCHVGRPRCFNLLELTPESHKTSCTFHSSGPNTFRNPDIQQNYKDIFDILTFSIIFHKKTQHFLRIGHQLWGPECGKGHCVGGTENGSNTVAPNRSIAKQTVPLPQKKTWNFKKHESLKLDDYLFKVAQVRDSFHVFCFNFLWNFSILSILQVWPWYTSPNLDVNSDLQCAQSRHGRVGPSPKITSMGLIHPWVDHRFSWNHEIRHKLPWIKAGGPEESAVEQSSEIDESIGRVSYKSN